MKTLYLVRHAKSSWENRSVSDFDRTLNERGKRDAPFMGRVLKEKDIAVDLMLSSPAVRALTTANIFADEISFPENKIVKEKDIYEADRSELMDVLMKTDDSVNNVMLFGHNPGITYLSNYLCNFETDNIPTCGVVCMEMDFDSWKYLGNKSCSFKFFEYPKKYL